jgi:hypothetical protein
MTSGSWWAPALLFWAPWAGGAEGATRLCKGGVLMGVSSQLEVLAKAREMDILVG